MKYGDGLVCGCECRDDTRLEHLCDVALGGLEERLISYNINVQRSEHEACFAAWPKPANARE
jgi:hypothetical protein